MTRFLPRFLGLIIQIIKYGLILSLVFFLISLVFIAPTYKNFKVAYQAGLAGKTDLTKAINYLQTQSWDESLASSQAAQENFNRALDELAIAKENIVIVKIPFFSRQANDLEYLLKTTEILSRSLERAVTLAQAFTTVNTGASSSSFADLDTDAKIRLLKLAYESEPELNGLKANLQIALLNINRIHRIGILWPIYAEISEYKTQLQKASALLENLGPLSRVLITLGGYPSESNLLIVLQNNDELRPTGGFIGTFGLATIKNGEVIFLATSDSYHLDMPAVGKWQKEPPYPIAKYLDIENWYLRDSNWTPDWPSAAAQIQEIYHGESAAVGLPATTFSGVIAINPDFVIDLLKLVGPIEIQGEIYTPENFQELLQYNVEVAYKDRGVSSWDRKGIINELLEELKNRLFNLSLEAWPNLITAFNDNIAAKNIQIHFTNPDLRFLSDNLGASGEMKNPDSDFFMVVDANLAAFKSDAVVKKGIIYNLEADSKNSQGAIAELSLDYKHEGGFDWRTTRYRSYTRIYLPRGSRFISSEGFAKNTADWSVSEDEALDKTVVSFFFSLEPGSSRRLTIKYALPDKINQQIQTSSYNLLVQKQSGRRTEKLDINLNLPGGQTRKWSSDLLVDKVFKP